MDLTLKVRLTGGRLKCEANSLSSRPSAATPHMGGLGWHWHKVVSCEMRGSHSSLCCHHLLLLCLCVCLCHLRSVPLHPGS